LEPGSVDLMPIIETAKGLHFVYEILTATPRLRRVCFGAGDFTRDLNLTWTRDESELFYARSKVVTESRAADREAPVDTVWVDLTDDEGVVASSKLARRLGFQGKLAIHPKQVEPMNRVFGSIGAAELDFAQKVVTGFAEAEAKGIASLTVDGQFIDYPIVEKAQRIVELYNRYGIVEG
ncbi:MAG: CoA ester lyase, partial [Chloroflexi bacterium]|nr:CoA ester lyase [Chloroflexota bacterium]